LQEGELSAAMELPFSYSCRALPAP
jgi:hypothetical protein